MSLELVLQKNLDLYKKHAVEFQRVFGVRLKQFFSNLTGFDVVEFDNAVVQSGDGCMRDVVKARWGEPGVTLIQQLIG